MAQWPEPENQRIPEGHYQFRLNREPEIIVISISDGKGGKRPSKRLKLYARGTGAKGEFGVIDSFVPWEERYSDLCKAIGVEHGKDIVMAGAVFEADIIHEPDPNNPSKVYARIQNIVVPEDNRTPEDKAAGDDVPF